MMPLTTSPTRSTYSSYIISRSASRMRCRMTCLAVCAAMRPKLSVVTLTGRIASGPYADQSMSGGGGSNSSGSTPSGISGSGRGRVTSSWPSARTSWFTCISPVSRSMSTRAHSTAPGVLRYAARSASSSATSRVSELIPFSRSICLIASMISRFT